MTKAMKRSVSLLFVIAMLVSMLAIPADAVWKEAVSNTTIRRARETEQE